MSGVEIRQRVASEGQRGGRRGQEAVVLVIVSFWRRNVQKYWLIV